MVTPMPVAREELVAAATILDKHTQQRGASNGAKSQENGKREANFRLPRR